MQIQGQCGDGMGSLREVLRRVRGSLRELLPGVEWSEELRLVPVALGHALTGQRALESLQSHLPSMDLRWVFQPEYHPCAQPGSGCWGGAEDAHADNSFVMWSSVFGKQNIPLCLCSHLLSAIPDTDSGVSGGSGMTRAGC